VSPKPRLNHINIFLRSCKEEPTSNPPSIFYDLHIEMSWWGSIEKARQAYPNLHPNEARETYTNEQRYEYFRSEKDPHKRHLMAAIIYLDYAQENTRARIAQCESLGVDISAFESNFEGQHKSEDSATDLILGQHNISRDMVWLTSRANLSPLLSGFISRMTCQLLRPN